MRAEDEELAGRKRAGGLKYSRESKEVLTVKQVASPHLLRRVRRWHVCDVITRPCPALTKSGVLLPCQCPALIVLIDTAKSLASNSHASGPRCAETGGLLGLDAGF
eukprot:3310705-Rhodomonas_salina.1